MPEATPYVIRTGAITITVAAPPDVLDMLASDDLLNSCSARLHCYPRTREQFDAIVTHAGGPEAFREPDANHYVATRNSAIMLYVPSVEPGRVTVLPPSLEALRAAQEDAQIDAQIAEVRDAQEAAAVDAQTPDAA